MTTARHLSDVAGSSGEAPLLVSVVLPNWNTRREVLEFLDSVSQQTYPSSNLEIIIADNGSTDGSQEAIRSWFHTHAGDGWRRLELVSLPKNAGIAVGYNAAYAQVSAESFAVLRAESDVVFATDLISILVDELASQPDVGVVGAKGVSYDAPDRLDHGARYMNWWTGLPWDADPPGPVQCDCVFGGTFIVRRSCIDQLGSFFMPDRFLASELELCTRIKRRGKRVIYQPRAISLHKIARSTSRVDPEKFAYVEYRERVLLNLLHNRLPSLAGFLGFTFAVCAKRALRGHAMCLHGFLDGLRSAWLRRPVAAPGMRADSESLAEWLMTPPYQAEQERS